MDRAHYEDSYSGSGVAPVENPVDTLRKQLRDHIKECSDQNRKVLWGLVGIFVYMITHDTEVLKHVFGGLFS